MGFLDRQSRVIDIVLTGRGRELFAIGELDFAYYAFFDDGLDYDPYSTGSLTDEQRDELIHSTPMLEAPALQDRRSAIIPLEPTSFVFKATAGYDAVPRIISPDPTGPQVFLRCDQVSSGSSFLRNGTSLAVVPLELSVDAAANEGFSVHFYSSGSAGLTELQPRTDLRGRRALDPFVAVAIDDETITDVPTPGKPFTLRKGGRG